MRSQITNKLILLTLLALLFLVLPLSVSAQSQTASVGNLTLSGYVNNTLGTYLNGAKIEFGNYTTHTQRTVTINNTDKHASGERTEGITYKQDYDIDLYILTRNDAAGDMYIRLYVDDVLIQDDDNHITAASPGNRSKWYRIPSYMNYRVDIDSTSMDYEWREYTFSDGYYELNNVSDGDYTILARQIGYRNATSTMAISANTEMNFTLSERKPTTVSMPGFSAISGLFILAVTIIIVRMKKKEKVNRDE